MTHGTRCRVLSSANLQGALGLPRSKRAKGKTRHPHFANSVLGVTSARGTPRSVPGPALAGAFGEHGL